MWFPLMKDCSQINLGKVTELGGLSLHIESVISHKCPKPVSADFAAPV